MICDNNLVILDLKGIPGSKMSGLAVKNMWTGPDLASLIQAGGRRGCNSQGLAADEKWEEMAG